MKFTLAWLREHLEFNASTEELCEKLTSIGLEVESLKDPKKDLNNFVVSEITDVSPHPNADKLKICSVDNGKEILQIVCGAPNVYKKMKSVLANIGCTIKPEKNDQFIIKKSKIRGVESFGMLCSEEELNLSDDSEGIIELSKDCKVGEKFSTYVSDENIEIEIAITPNRVDCAGVYGIARDLSAAGFGILKLRKANKVAVENKSSIKLKNTLQDSVCPQFLLREITHLKNRKSSSAIIKRFKGSGLKVISSLVDITNYITIDFCRPLHVFDLDKIQGNITIRLSEKGEEFLGLDEKNYSLDENMIVICDEKNIISLAGILGGKNTCCDDNTKNILVESAYFDPEIIASAGRKLNITSDARYRFERGIDPNSTEEGLELATKMIVESCGGRVGSIVGNSNIAQLQNKVNVEKNFFENVLGYPVKEKEVEEKLIKLGCKVKTNNESIDVVPPSWRPDLKIKEDFVEEVGRLIGFEKIPNSSFELKNNFELEVTSFQQKLKRQIRELLVSRNIMEIITWSFSNKKWEESLNSKNNIIEIENPISSELSCLRTDLLGGLLNVVYKNNNKNIQNISVFEIGPVFIGTQPGSQVERLTIVRSGNAIDKNWTSKNREFDIYDLKSDLMSVLKLLNIERNIINLKEEKKVSYHPGKNGSLFIGENKIASFGELHPNILKKFKIKNKTCICELYFTEILNLCRKKSDVRERFFKSNFQSSIRDFSFDIEKNLKSQDIVDSIKKIDNKIISDVKVFDNYESSESRSIAIEVVMQSDDKTLTEQEISDLSERIIQNAKKKFNAKLR